MGQSYKKLSFSLVLGQNIGHCLGFCGNNKGNRSYLRFCQRSMGKKAKIFGWSARQLEAGHVVLIYDSRIFRTHTVIFMPFCGQFSILWLNQYNYSFWPNCTLKSQANLKLNENSIF